MYFQPRVLFHNPDRSFCPPGMSPAPLRCPLSKAARVQPRPAAPVGSAQTPLTSLALSEEHIFLSAVTPWVPNLPKTPGPLCTMSQGFGVPGVWSVPTVPTMVPGT